ncbi:nucleoside hydrolase [Neobacillus sp. 19]|uniref:nucleoside hydrolase n=1 Tax=Neobacillus sp. 19 TaxID=3394458 RepID=UPI003BF706CB
MRKPIIFDCDPGHDDAIALLLALSSEQLDVKLITTAAGNQTQDKTILNARKLLSFIGVHHVEIARGAEKPIVRELIIADNIHGETGLDGADLGVPIVEESNRSALEAMRSILLNAEGKMTIIATGPLTNVAILFLAYPELKEKIECISLMGGCGFGGNWTPAAEFNIYVDPEAADIVFRSGVPIIMSGLDVTHKAQILKEDIERIRRIDNKTSRVIASLLDFFSENSPPYYLSKEPHIKTAHLHDPCAVAYLIDQTLFQGIDCYVGIETSGRLTTGCTVVDINRRSGMESNVKFLFDIDRERFIDRIVSAIKYFR